MHIRIKKGLDLPLSGIPEQAISPAAPSHHVALNGEDYPGLKAKLQVTPQQRVRAGDPLFFDKKDSRVQYTAPASGTVAAVNWGPRRCLQHVVIRVEGKEEIEPRFEAHSDREIQRLGRELLVERLAQSGLWPAFRTRPFSRVPHSGSQPRSIFVTAIDTQPLAADPRVIIQPHLAAFKSGLTVLSGLTDGTVWLCTGPDWDFQLAAAKRVREVRFSGPHPAGLAGTHIHFLDPAGLDRTVWHVGYQDVIAIGRLFSEGRLFNERVIAIAGELVRQPRLIRACLGASIRELTEGEIEPGTRYRTISGSVLSGRAAPRGEGFLGRYHNQLSVVREGGERRLFGWLGGIDRPYTAASTFLRTSGQRRLRAFSTALNGRHSAMLPVRVFERIMPLDILPSVLFRSLMVGDTDRAQALGCLELDEEDLALCSFACPAKSDYGALLRLNLEKIEQEE